LLDGGQRRRAGGVQAGWVAEAAGADASRCVDIEDDVVRASCIGGNSTDSREMIEAQILPDTPGDVVIRARRIAADADAADDPLAGRVQRKPAAEHVDAADLPAVHRIAAGAEQR